METQYVYVKALWGMMQPKACLHPANRQAGHDMILAILFKSLKGVKVLSNSLWQVDTDFSQPAKSGPSSVILQLES